MNRFSLQRVSDKEVNSVLMQVEDALNTLVDELAKVEPAAKKQTKAMANALSARIAAIGGWTSIRMVLPPNEWVPVPFPGQYELTPNIDIQCFAVDDVNRRVTYKLRNFDKTGFEIFVKEDVKMQLNISAVTDETVYIPSDDGGGLQQ